MQKEDMLTSGLADDQLVRDEVEPCKEEAEPQTALEQASGAESEMKCEEKQAETTEEERVSVEQEVFEAEEEPTTHTQQLQEPIQAEQTEST